MFLNFYKKHIKNVFYIYDTRKHTNKRTILSQYLCASVYGNL